MTDSTQHKHQSKSHIPFRLNLLFFGVFLLFSALIVRLGYLQIVRGEEFEAIVRRTETTTVTQSVPRGEIYDRNGNILVGNEAQHAITYTRGVNVSAESMAKTAATLAEMITMETGDLTERDLKDYWAATHEDALLERLSEDEKSLSGGELYEAQLEKIAPEETAYSEKELQAAAIYKKMNGASSLTTVNIKNVNVTEEELAVVSENLDTMNGVDVSKDWTRYYPNGDLLSTILGEVTSEQAGLPSNQAEAYLAKGYARNDRVGNAYLEQQYEPVLSGAKAVYETVTNQDGEVVSVEEAYPGKKGDNLLLTIDINFQKEIEKIATDFLNSKADPWNDRVYIVAMNPQNGDIIGMAGKIRDTETGEIKDNVHGVLNENFVMGSSIKGATVLAGYMDGVITLTDNTMIDEPLVFSDGTTKASLFNRQIGNQVPLNDIDALRVSSNTYMMKIAMKMGGVNNYSHGMNLNLDRDKVLTKLRYYYAQFGLGARTGIDLPSESTGIQGIPDTSGLVLDEAYGQFDLYTPLQLAQYVSTIANGGTRFAPRLVSEIRGTDGNGNLGPVELEMKPTVMNQLDVDAEVIKRVHAGMWEVTHNPGAVSTAYFGANDQVGIAGKTGTAETFYAGPVEEIQGEPVSNTTFVSFGPFENPEIAVAVVVPYMKNTTAPPYATILAKRALDAYFANKQS